MIISVIRLCERTFHFRSKIPALALADLRAHMLDHFVAAKPLPLLLREGAGFAGGTSIIKHGIYPGHCAKKITAQMVGDIF